MIIDAHCHAWETWPYQPPVPDPQSRARVEQLLVEMDHNGVGRAVVICAGLDQNPDNNGYIHREAQRFPERIVQFADVDSRWLATHHTAGAAGRLQAAVERYALKGFTHYLREDDDGSWLLGADGLQFLAVADRCGLILSLACVPQQMPVVARVAERFPTLPILCHHMARVRADPVGKSGIAEIITAARHANVHVKISGFGYAAPPETGYPYPELAWVVRTLAEFFGPERLLWGSDYPVVRRFMTYAQSLDVARRHLGFLPPQELALILGGNMERLLKAAGASG